MSGALMHVEVDKAKMAAVERALRKIPRQMPRIVYRSLKRTAAMARTDLDRRIRDERALRKKDVMHRIVDAEKASYANWCWRLALGSKRLAVAAFKNVRQTRAGVAYDSGRGRRLIPRAFVSRGFTHYETDDYIASKSVWRRAKSGEAGFTKGTPTARGDMVRRKPLLFLRGPSIARVVSDAPGLLAAVHREGQARLAKEIDSRVRVEIERRWPR